MDGDFSGRSDGFEYHPPVGTPIRKIKSLGRSGDFSLAGATDRISSPCGDPISKNKIPNGWGFSCGNDGFKYHPVGTPINKIPNGWDFSWRSDGLNIIPVGTPLRKQNPQWMGFSWQGATDLNIILPVGTPIQKQNSAMDGDFSWAGAMDQPAVSALTGPQVKPLHHAPGTHHSLSRTIYPSSN